LLTRAACYCSTNDRILLLGTPTLAAMASKVLHSQTCIYIGEDNAITRQVAAVNERIAEQPQVRFCSPGALSPNQAAVVVLDPPWYFDFLRPMLRAAAYACCAGGHILVSLPPIGANSHAAEDRVQLFKLFAKLSVNILSIVPDAIHYDTPYFEENALAASGYPNVPKTWRRGDLFVLEKARNAVDFELGLPTRQRGWHEVVIGRMRLFVTKKEPCHDAAMHELRSIVAGDVLPTVRRADPRRKHANVWTSGNRIFTAARPDLVRIAALAAAAGGAIDESIRLTEIEKDAVVRISYALGELAIKEHFEERRSEFKEAACRTLPFRSRSVSLPTTSRLMRSGASI
jgi:hypothetical protein